MTPESCPRDLFRRYNALLSRTHIDLGCEERPELLTEQYNRATKDHELRRVSLSQRNKFVRRVFYRGDWNLGGRYHGGWWQQVPSRYRQHILIDGGHTIEADYSGFHIALAYALEGRDPPPDPYALRTTEPADSEQQRADIKLLALQQSMPTAGRPPLRPSETNAIGPTEHSQGRPSQLYRRPTEHTTGHIPHRPTSQSDTTSAQTRGRTHGSRWEHHHKDHRLLH